MQLRRPHLILALLVLALAAAPFASRAAADDGGHLARELSPYLLSHAADAVEWHAWGTEAVEHAQKKERPIFLLVGGYGSLRDRSLEGDFLRQAEALEVLAKEYVAVIADRDERPDLADALRLVARTDSQVTAADLDGPLAAILTPEMRPILVRPLRAELAGHLLRLALEYRELKGEVETRAGVAAAALQEAQRSTPPLKPLGEEIVANAVRGATESFDKARGLFSRRPNRPPHAVLRLLLAESERTHNLAILKLAESELGAMARGGLRDHVGGGFFRETDDLEWQLPRYEKRLVDNALLLDAYARLYALTGSALARDAAQDIADWALREMRDPTGAFLYASVTPDGDDGGRFYSWTQDEIREVLGPADAASFLATYRLSPSGVLSLAAGEASPPRVLLARLRERRSVRPAPPLDPRVFVSANGFMIAALARSGRVFDRPADLSSARRAYEAVMARLDEPLVLRRLARGSDVAGFAFLEDYLALALGCSELFDATSNGDWAMRANSLVDQARGRFGDPSGGFFSIDRAHTPFLVRAKSGFDVDDVPAANALIVEVLLSIERASGERYYGQVARQTVDCFLGDLERAPGGLAGMAKAAGDLLGRPAPKTAAGAPGRARETRGPVTLTLALAAGKARPRQSVEAHVDLTIAKPWSVIAPSSADPRLAALVVSLLNEDLTLEVLPGPAGGVETPAWSSDPVALLRGAASVALRLRVPARTAPGERRVRVRVRYQACDKRDCQPPESVVLEVPLTITAPRP
jgi:uncharacterized protein YyaL (SSP411 family)